MKTNQITSLITILFLVGCSSTATPTLLPTLPKPTRTFTSTPTNTPESTLTPTIVPVMTAVTCQSASNPWKNLSYSEYNGYWLPNIEITRVCVFSGQIVRGQVYKHQITQNLILCLIPGTEGWYIVVSDALPNSCDISSKDFIDFVPVVSPPWRESHSVDGSQFRNKDNTEDLVYGSDIQQIWGFNFVFNRDDYTEQKNQLNPTFKCPAVCRDIPRSSGTLTVGNIKLGNLIPNSKAWIEYMEFEVKIYLPAE